MPTNYINKKICPRITLITRKKKKTIRAIREICGKIKKYAHELH